MKYAKVTDPNVLAQLNSSSSTKVTDPNLLSQLNGQENPSQEPEEKFMPPEQEGIGSWLPRDILIGLANMGHTTLNTPHDSIKRIEHLGNDFGSVINKSLPVEQYIGNNTLPGSSSMLQGMVDNFNKQHNVPESIQNKDWNKSLSERIPHQKEYDFAKMLGQDGSPSTGDKIIQKGIEYAPELLSLASITKNILPLTAKGITKKMSAHKSAALNEARSEYGNLFNDAAKQGITHVPPPRSAVINRSRITANSQSKHNKSLNEYLQNPTLENAHWAQSELGSLERYLNSIADKTGLTPTQHKTLKAVEAAKKDVRDSMFSNHIFGSNSDLAKRYDHLSNKYKEKVIPYTRLKQLTQTEGKKMKPKTAVKELLNDDQFMIELSKRYPGLFLHKPSTQRALKAAAVIGTGIGGYKGIKELLK